MKLGARPVYTGRKSPRLVVTLTAVMMFFLLMSMPGTVHSAPADTAECLPSFPDRDGWYGGDGAYSILLDDGRTLWLFGDTFAADTEGRPDRTDMDLVLGTTLAISTCTQEGRFDIRYFLRKKDGRFISSFGDGQWVWPQDPFKVHGRLYIPLVIVEPRPAMEGPFKFRITGHKIAVIHDNCGENPYGWPLEYLDWTAAVPEGIAALATTSIVYGKAVYFYPFCVPSRRAPDVFGNILVRIPTDKIHDPAGAMEYYAKDGSWQKGLDPANARIVLEAGVPELSVRYHESRKRWIAVYLSMHEKKARLLCRSAEKLEGPWSEPEVLIGTIPEVNPADPKYDPDNFCYAGKEHIQFAGPDKLVTTYVCNSFADTKGKDSFIRSHLFLYRPVVNRVSY